ncbi:hypothetical protein ACEPAI_2754 [Sanghuangporus weigelae]
MAEVTRVDPEDRSSLFDFEVSTHTYKTIDETPILIDDRIVEGRIWPPTIFLQCSEDSVVPLAGIEKFVDFLRRHKAVKGLEEGRDDDEMLRLVVHRGEHAYGFDNVLHIDDEDWLKESVAFIERHWLARVCFPGCQ